MRIAIDVREANGQKTGKGYFTYGLISELLEIDQTNQYELYSDKAENPFPQYENIVFKHVEKKGFGWHLAVLKELKANSPDLYFSPTSYIIPALAPRRLKVMITVHDLVAFLFPKNHQKKAVLIEKITLRSALKKAIKIAVVSENTQNDLLKLFPIAKSLTVEIPCAPNDIYRSPFDQTKAAEIRAKFNLPEKFILAVGTLEPRKNFNNLIKSFVIVKREHPDYKLVIVGKKGWQNQIIDQLVAEYNLQNEVIFPGYMTDSELHYAYHSAVVFVFPSLYEGFGIPPLEAMASGCPVVSSNAASLNEVVGDAGLLIDPKNPVKIADAIGSLIENQELRSIMIERGFRRSQKFTWTISARILLDAFKEIESNTGVSANVS